MSARNSHAAKVGDAAQQRYSGMRSLSGVLEHNRVMRAARDASVAEPEPECLYSVREDGTIAGHEITRRTTKTVYFANPGRWYWAMDWVDVTLPDGTTGRELRHTGERKLSHPEDGRVSRALLERDGEVCRCMYGSARYCHAGFGGKPIPAGHVLYASRQVAEAIASGDPKQLRKIMADAHPDRGGTSQGFIAARKRYEEALRRAS